MRWMLLLCFCWPLAGLAAGLAVMALMVGFFLVLGYLGFIVLVWIVNGLVKVVRRYA